MIDEFLDACVTVVGVLFLAAAAIGYAFGALLLLAFVARGVIAVAEVIL